MPAQCTINEVLEKVLFAFFREKIAFYLRISKKNTIFALAFDKKPSGYSSARLECLLWEQEVVSSNLAIPTKKSMIHKPKSP